MRLSIPQYAQALLELEKEGNVAETASRFFTWLARRGEGKKMGRIVKEAERILKMQSGVMEVTITTAEESSVETQGVLRAEAEKIFASQSVDAKFVTDADLIGGVKMRSDSFLYDATLSTAVRKLRIALTR